jgi:hypothetical protein
MLDERNAYKLFDRKPEEKPQLEDINVTVLLKWV